MTIKEFVNKIGMIKNEDTIKKNIQSIIKTDYAPLLSKKIVIQRMFDKSVSVDKDTGVKYIDMFVNRVNFNIGLMLLYTNLDLTDTSEDKLQIFNDYDLLVQSGVLEMILTTVGKVEIDRCLNVQKDIMDTFYDREKCTEAYVSRQVNTITTIIGASLNTASDKLVEAMNGIDDSKIDKIGMYLKGVLKR